MVITVPPPSVETPVEDMVAKCSCFDSSLCVSKNRTDSFIMFAGLAPVRFYVPCHRVGSVSP